MEAMAAETSSTITMESLFKSAGADEEAPCETDPSCRYLRVSVECWGRIGQVKVSFNPTDI